jgi:hypothetical protein
MAAKKDGRTGIIKMLTASTLMVIILQCFPAAAFGAEFNLRARTRNAVEKKDDVLTSIKTSVNYHFNKSLGIIEGLTGQGFSLFERHTGLDQKNRVYAAFKNTTLHKIGFQLGIVEGAKDVGLLATELVVDTVTAPVGLLNTGYNIKEDPEKYKNMVTYGAASLFYTLANPRPLVNNVSQSIKTTLAEANKSPLKRGKLEGKVVAGIGTCVLIGVSTAPARMVSLANKLEKLTQVGRTGQFILPKRWLYVSNLKVTSKATGVSSSQINVASRATTVLPSLKLISNTKVGDLFDGVKITKIEGNRLTLANGNKLYENVRLVEGEDVLAKVDLARFTPRNNLLVDELSNPAQGRFLYVIDPKGNLLMTKSAKGKYHSQLVQGGPVKYSGEIYFKDGIITKIDRVSGHYLPRVEDFDANLPIFQKYFPGVTRDLFNPDIPDWLETMASAGNMAR